MRPVGHLSNYSSRSLSSIGVFPPQGLLFLYDYRIYYAQNEGVKNHAKGVKFLTLVKRNLISSGNFITFAES